MSFVPLSSRTHPFYPNMDAFIMDRACVFAPSARDDFKHIKYWVVDTFHAQKHKKACPCNPLHVKRLGKRVKGVNMSAAEHVFSWFRSYAKLLNEDRAVRHTFKVLYFVKEHNAAVQAKKAIYLNKFQSMSKKTSKSYACVKNTSKKKVVKNVPKKKPAIKK